MTPPPSKRVRLGSSLTSKTSAPSQPSSNSTSRPRTASSSGSSESNTNAQQKDKDTGSGKTEMSEFAQVTSLPHMYLLKEMPLSEVYYVPSVVVPSEAEEWYDGLLGLDSWYQPKLKIFGREVTQSRKIAAYSTDPSLILKYSGQTVDMSYTYPPLLRLIQDKVEHLLGVRFNHVMLNLYEDGGVYIGNHRDNLENKVIASLSLGAPRMFIMTRDHKVKPPAPGLSEPHSSPSSLPLNPEANIITRVHDQSQSPPSSSQSESIKTERKRNRKRKSEQALGHDANECEDSKGSIDRFKKNKDDDTVTGINSTQDQETNRVIESEFGVTRGDIDRKQVGKHVSHVSNVEKKTWVLEPGSLVVMQGETQRYWKHQIPKEPKVKGGRISLTFRQLVSGASS